MPQSYGLLLPQNEVDALYKRMKTVYHTLDPPRLRPSSPSLSGDIRSMIHADVENLHAISLFLRQHLNTLSPTSRLPDDVLIVLIDHIYATGGFKGVVTVTHVCRRWRSLAMNRPSLWSVLSSTMPSWTSTILERNNSLPLAIDWVATFANQFEVVEPLRLALEALSRTQLLRLRLSLPVFAELADILNKTAPLLQAADLEVCGTDGRYTPQTPLDILAFCPDLQSLTLRDMNLSWNPVRRWPALTSLSVDFSYILPNGRTHLSLSDLLNILSTIPNLQSLHFSGGVDTRNSASALTMPLATQLAQGIYPLDDNVRVPLVFLKTLDIEFSDILSIVQLMRNLDLPPSCDLVFRCTDNVYFGIPNELLIGVFVTLALNATVVEDVFVEDHGGRRTSSFSDFLRITITSRVQATVGTRMVQLDLEDVDEDLYGEILQNISRHAFLRHIKALVIAIPSEAIPRILLNCIENFVSVGYLHFTTTTTFAEFRNALAVELLRHPPPTQATAVLMPGVRHISFRFAAEGMIGEPDVARQIAITERSPAAWNALVQELGSGAPL